MPLHPRVHEWQTLLLRPDIANCLAFSKLRCVISVISLLLLATDIPRSGLGVRRLDEYYPPLKPDTAVRFGPFDYPVRHIWRIRDINNDADSFRGLEGSDSVDSANVWSYKYDTTSVGLRGAVELLNVTEYPDYLLYRGELGKKNNHRAVLGLNTTFLMLDAFIGAAQAQILPDNRAINPSWGAIRFTTKHIWVDRAHQYLTQFIRQCKFWSLHSLHVPIIPHQTNTLRICSTAMPYPQPQPRFCTYSGIWECENPLNVSLPRIRISEQMDIRFQDLQRRYPDLKLDVAILSTHRPSMTSGTLSLTFFNCEEHEIIMLTRGRRCSGNETKVAPNFDECATVFVDDYRYERNILQTNVADWYFFIAAMRAAAQNYFWARLILLYCTAFLASKELGDDTIYWYKRVISAVLIVFKIPFQVIVYSSLLPVVCYVAALLLDGNFMDIYLDSYWSTLEGASNFEFMSFLNSAVTQMRTVWLMALLVDLMVLVARKRINGSEEKILGIRGLAISFTSALTIIGPYRQTTFRNSKVVKALHLPDVGQRMDTVMSTPQWFFNESTYMFDDSMTMLIFCIGAVVTITSALRLVSFYLRADQGLVLISTINVPYGTEFLWPMSSLSVRFNTLTNSTAYQYDRYTLRQSVIKNSPEPQYLSASPVRSSYFNNSKVSPSTFAELSETTAVQSRIRRYLCDLYCRKRVTPTVQKAQPPIGGLCSRTAESHSILQLMNIAMMTDPWNFFWLRVLGIQLYLYRIHPTRSMTKDVDDSGSLLSYAVILPYPKEEMEERTGLSFDDFQLLDSASSRDLPMSVLLQCG
ncbi:hypothetical protein F442_04936 [Phytophthora nicotianae P10297]|uniref:Uncharacterized protein n=2 Tax=Phytophthora nicotianae TaxID=4792 RepID=W2ZTI8_PHYNI|nr:hypothetical protein L916_04697 [Phytophthora nicotianae]ETP49529.1 hypothetical protein F442_04936 [Phytophthora nicotianae P10297]